MQWAAGGRLDCEPADNYIRGVSGCVYLSSLVPAAMFSYRLGFWTGLVVMGILCEGLARHTRGDEIADLIAMANPAPLLRTSIGVTRRGTAIDAVLHRDDLDFGTAKTRILLVGGARGDRQSLDATLAILSWFYQGNVESLQQRFVLSAVPCLNPDGLALGVGPSNGSGGDPTLGYPPGGSAYDNPTNPEAAYAWRWIGLHAPDVVVEVTPGEAVAWEVVKGQPGRLVQSLDDLQPLTPFAPDDSLVGQLPTHAAAEVGTLPALRLKITSVEALAAFQSLLLALQTKEYRELSAARQEIQRRLDRSPMQVAEQLLEHYGRNLSQVVYIPALAVIARARFERLQSDRPDYSEVERIVAPYYRGEKATTPTNGSGLSGHLVFCELAELFTDERRDRYLELARVAADLAFNGQGQLQPAMPFHNEMSDAVFMGGPILARVGQLTGDRRYFDASLANYRFMRGLVLRPDGLYRHSPLDEAAWGRGNGFPAIGIAMCLSHWPEDHAGRTELLAAFQQHMAALGEHQDPTGCWHQVIDHPESYRELTATCMIQFAMTRGVRRGWLDRATYGPLIERAWYAVRTRVGSDGRLVDVCTGTGKQKSLRDYYDRPAILGPDDRGGAMALLAAIELEEWKRERQP